MPLAELLFVVSIGTVVLALLSILQRERRTGAPRPLYVKLGLVVAFTLVGWLLAGVINGALTQPS